MVIELTKSFGRCGIHIVDHNIGLFITSSRAQLKGFIYLPVNHGVGGWHILISGIGSTASGLVKNDQSVFYCVWWADQTKIAFIKIAFNISVEGSCIRLWLVLNNFFIKISLL